MITILSAGNSVVSVWMQELRDINIQSDRARFRNNVERIGQVAAYEISKVLDYNVTTFTGRSFWGWLA